MFLQDTRNKLSLASFFGQLSISMINFSLIYHLKERGFSSSEIGIASSLYPLFYFFFCMIFPKVIRRHSQKKEIIASFIGMSVAVLSVLFSPSKALVFISLGVYGAAMALLWPNIETWITEGLEGNELSRSVSKFNFSWSFGTGISTFIAGYLTEVNTRVPIMLSALVMTILIFLILSAKGGNGGSEEESSEAEDSSTPLRYFSWIAILLLYSGYSLVITIYPLYAMEVLGFKESLTGTLLLFRGLTACIAFVILGRVSFWQFKVSWVLILQIAFIALIYIMGFIESAGAFIVYFILFGIIFSMIYVSSIFHGASGAKNRAKRMMIHEVLLTIGTIAGSFFGGFIYQYFSFQAILNAISLVSLAALIVELPIMKRMGCFTKAGE